MIQRVVVGMLSWCGKLLFWLGLYRLIIWWNRRQPKVVLYHACEESESDFIRGLGANTRPEVFASHVEFFSKHYNVVTLAELESGNLPPRAVVVTFDDGYRSVFENAYPLLLARGLPATVYLVTAVVGNDAMIWVNELNWFLRRHPGVASARATAVLRLESGASPEAIIEKACAGYDSRAIEGLLRDLRATLGIEYERLCRGAQLYLSWGEVLEMSQHGFSFGSHTETHSGLLHVDEAVRRDEMVTARCAVLERLRECTSFAYPFGACDAETRRLALQMGYRSIMEVGGVNCPVDLTRVGRVAVKATTHAGLFAEMEVVAPIKARLGRLFGR